MPDINQWVLAYGSTSLTFGTLASTYPFSTQVDIGEPDATYGDQDHPTSDGQIMGRDRLGGFTLSFDFKMLGDFPLSATPWATPLDLLGSFKSKWRADSLRRVPGAYATLTNSERARLVYGRPRKCTPKTDRLRRSVLEAVATFDTISPDFYSATEKVQIITPVPPSSGGFTLPLSPPFSTTVGSGQLVSTITNAGDVEAWPILEFHGPGAAHSYELLSGSTSLWTLQVARSLAADEILRIDTRPWSRSATLNGAPANGYVAGTQIEKCKIPVGTNFSARYRVNDRTGTAYADLRWRDAYASL